MPAAKTITPGDKFGRLIALETIETRTYPSGTNIHFRECRCDCGEINFVSETKLRSGHTKSCGCLQAEITTKRSTTHGYSPRLKPRPRIYGIWCNMINRCTNPKVPHFRDYGGRGITVCERWLNSFENFLEDMGEPPPGLTIDRTDNNGNYEPENCEWKTRIDQARNRRSSLKITFDGLTLTVAEWSQRIGIGRRTIEARYHSGWSAEQILTTEVGAKK
jgi:hypothetical protein